MILKCECISEGRQGRRLKEEHYQKLEHTLRHHGSIVDFYEDTMRMPNGDIVHWDYIQHKGAAAILPVLPDGRILMVHQYRIGPDCETLEIPAGGLNPGEDMKTCAVRECEEETGWRVDGDASLLLTIYTTPAFCNEKIEVYLAEHLVPGRQHLDPDEFVHVEAKTLDEIVEMILNGEIIDTKTVSAVLTYQALLKKREEKA